jgi:hypothetical protein
MTYVSDRETVEAAIRADRTAPSKARRDEALLALVARADQEFADVAGYSDLTDSRRLRLFAALLAAQRRYELRASFQKIPKDSAAMALLDNVRQSIAMVSKFGETALGVRHPTKDEWIKEPTRQGAKALSMLEAGAERWAELVPLV